MLCLVPSTTRLQAESGAKARTTFTRTSKPQLLYTCMNPFSTTAFTHAGAGVFACCIVRVSIVPLSRVGVSVRIELQFS